MTANDLKNQAIEKAMADSMKRKLEGKLYKPLDDFLKRLKKKIKELFAPLYVSGFDQLHVIRLTEMSEKLYSELDEFNRKNYFDLVEHAREWAESVLGKKLPDTDLKKFVDAYLKGYDPVTQYVYTKEIDRKRMRMEEAILTAKEFQDIGRLQKAIKKAADLWYTQSSQYALDLMDASLTQAFEEDDDDVPEYRWVTFIDGRECEVCHERNGNVYPIDEYPPKPHYGCRCIKIPVKAYSSIFGTGKRS